jgi:protein-tyrosine phosphatase
MNQFTLPSILFVCMGNLCRSPAAEIIWAHRVSQLEQHGWQSKPCDSAGTIGYHRGSPPDSRMQAALRKAAYTPFGTARQVEVADLQRFDLILAMDPSNLATLRTLAESAGLPHHHCHLILDYAGITQPKEVPDPYYGGNSGFARVVHLLETASDALVLRFTGTSGYDAS